MSSISSRGGDAEVSEGARLDADAAERWLQRRKQTAAENAARESHRECCLESSRLHGAAAGGAGCVASVAAFYLRGTWVRAPSLAAVGVWIATYMPFQLVAQLSRTRCASRFRAPADAAQDAVR